ncbi:cell division protein FtsZ [Desulfatirhabdium butyrativorans]|uniref:cell division protein FtsZ n=1 Tax=Desulfatirhabdium butyrativorans TaxID=340467 RepID=UPI0003FCD40A|nr:cell division protein FtsZ [Desulfatirhabdium butyrativorans]
MGFTYLETEMEQKENDQSAVIKVIGVGGAGKNAVNTMIDSNIKGVSFIAANTDAQDLARCKAPIKIQLGEKLLNGLGAGSDPQQGKEAALESEDMLRSVLEGANMVFIASGFGGGTGTGASPVIAELCKSMNILTVAVVTKPFRFEGKPREKNADEGIELLRQHADAVIVIPNNKLHSVGSKNTPMLHIFKKADEVLLNSVKGITDLIYSPGYVNLDFQDVRKIMSKSGMALMGIGSASGENRAILAAEQAFSHPLLEDISIASAKGVLLNITSSEDITYEEMTSASERIYKEIGENDTTEIIWGQIFDNTLENEVRVTLIATGIGHSERRNLKVLAGGKKVAPYTGAYDDTYGGRVRPAPPFGDDEFELPELKWGNPGGAPVDVKEDPSGFGTSITNLDMPAYLRSKGK